MKRIFIIIQLIVICIAQNIISSEPMRHHDLTPSSEIVRQGKLLMLTGSTKVDGVESIPCSKLVYVLGQEKLYPEKNLEATETVFKKEGFLLKAAESSVHQLVSGLCELYIGYARILLNDGYYLRHMDGAPEDRETLLRLKKICHDPTSQIDGNRWNITFYVMEDGVVEPIVEKYNFTGVVFPFRITKCTMEVIDFVPKITIKTPTPR
jgi:hypothetical protein